MKTGLTPKSGPYYIEQNHEKRAKKSCAKASVEQRLQVRCQMSNFLIRQTSSRLDIDLKLIYTICYHPSDA
jgi:hypothetical protein